MPDIPDIPYEYNFDRSQQELGLLGTNLSKQTSPFAGISSAADVRSKFGLGTSAADIYNPLFTRLARGRGGALARASSRAGASATPEASLFAPIEESYAGQEEQLLSEQGKTEEQQREKIADLLYGTLGQQSQFGLQQAQIGANIWGDVGKNELERRKVEAEQRQANVSPWALALGALGGAAMHFIP